MLSTRSRMTSKGGRSSGFSDQHARMSLSQKGGHSTGTVGRSPRVPTANTTYEGREQTTNSKNVHLKRGHALEGVFPCYYFPKHYSKTASSVREGGHISAAYLYTSAFVVYNWFLITSGAVQHGVPHAVSCAAEPVSTSTFERPKSQTLVRQLSSSSRLCDFKSR